MMATFWKYLPFLIKLLTAVVGMSGAVTNVALTQVGDGAPLTEWWKVIPWGVAGLIGTVTTVTHHFNETKTALNTAPPGGSSVEYLGRIAAEQVVNGNAGTLSIIEQLRAKIK